MGTEKKNAALAVVPGADAGQAIEALVMKGDISALEAPARAAYYVQLCTSLDLNPATQPIKFIQFQGKLIPYFTRDATDQLAAKHRLNREITEGPKVVDFAGHKLLYAFCKASLPNGRVETASAYVPIPHGGGEGLANAAMKTETKSRRRATLAILGLGFLDESELDTMSGAQRLTHAQVMSAPPIGATVEECQPAAEIEEPAHPALDRLRDRLCDGDSVATLEAVVDVYEELARETNDPAVRRAAGEACVAHMEETLGLTKHRVKFAEATRAAERERAAAKRAVAESTIPAEAVAQILADLDAARSSDELADIAAEIAKLPGLVRGSTLHKRLTDAYKAAAARLSPKPPRGGAPKPEAAANDGGDPERSAIESESGDSPVAREEAAWRAHLATKHHAFEIANSAAKHAGDFPALGADRLVRIAADRIVAVSAGTPHPMGTMGAVNAIRAAIAERARKHARKAA